MTGAGDTTAELAPALQVRRALLDDVEAIACVHVATWRVAYRGLMPDAVIEANSEARRAELWRSILQSAEHGVYVALIGGAVAGFCEAIASRDADAARDTGEIAAIYVAPARWRAGIGSALIAAAVEHAERAGQRELTLWVLDTNASARRFYERQGFHADGACTEQMRLGHTLRELRYRRPLVARRGA
jgi:ribosomal protein S18 acetylase RimI-like enzyme